MSTCSATVPQSIRISCEAKSVIQNRDKRAESLSQPFELVQDKGGLANYDCQLWEFQNKREHATKMVTVVKENLKSIKTGKLKAELREAEEELAEDGQRAVKKKAGEASTTNEKDNWQRSEIAKAATCEAVKKNDAECRQQIREEQTADQAAARHKAEQAAAKKTTAVEYTAAQKAEVVCRQQLWTEQVADIEFVMVTKSLLQFVGGDNLLLWLSVFTNVKHISCASYLIIFKWNMFLQTVITYTIVSSVP